MGSEVPLVDRFGRRVRDLRISVTDRCDFRCLYCMPAEGMRWLPRDEILTFEEIYRIAALLVGRYGVQSIRLTGGEPTVRAHLSRLVSLLHGIVVPETGRPVELAMTTNGASLERIAEDLRAAGLDRVNISCDSLRPERFAAITRRDALERVLAGIDAATAAGLDPVKVNVVVVRNLNDDEIVDFAAFGREHQVEVRFIEFMPLDASAEWSRERVVAGEEIVEAIRRVWPLTPEPSGAAPATRFHYEDGAGTIGVIPSVTQPFCARCDRIRLTAEGQLRNCLFATEETDLRTILRTGGDDDALAATIEASVAAKWAGHHVGRVTFVRPARTMSQIGG